MIYPDDAITIPFNVDANTTFTLLGATTSPRTILNIHITNFANSLEKASEINCGFIRIGAGYYNVPVDDRQMILPCSEEITVANGDTDNPSLGQIVYVNRDFSTSSFQTFKNGFTYGEIVLSVFLFLLWITILTGGILKWYNFTKPRKKKL